MLVVLRDPTKLIAPPLPFTRIAPDPASTVIPPFTRTPLPVRLTLPPTVVIPCPTVRPAAPNNVTEPELVEREPLVPNVPLLLRKSIFPLPVLKLPAGNVSVVPAIAVMLVFASRVGNSSVKAFASRTETAVPVDLSVTAPLKSLVALVSEITPLTASKLEIPVTVTAPAVWLIEPTPVAFTLRFPLRPTFAPKFTPPAPAVRLRFPPLIAAPIWI